MISNVAFAMLFNKLQKIRLYLLLIVSYLLLITVAIFYGSLQVGAYWVEAPGGLVRVTFDFFLGVAIGRLQIRNVVVSHWISWLLPLLVIISFIPDFRGITRMLYDLVVVAVVYPFAILIGAQGRSVGLQRVVFRWLGEISYPLYLLHMPVVYILAGTSVRILHGPVELFRPYSGLAFSFIAIVCSAIAAFLIDIPVQKWLRQS